MLVDFADLAFSSDEILVICSALVWLKVYLTSLLDSKNKAAYEVMDCEQIDNVLSKV